MADSVEKVLCAARAKFMKAAGVLDAVGREGPRQSTQDRRAIFLVLWQWLLLPEFA